VSQIDVRIIRLLTRIRRDLATAYLRESGWAVTEVAFALGFADVGSFSRAFRRDSPGSCSRRCAPM
jgi:AraC-like DNA-binding protein